MSLTSRTISERTKANPDLAYVTARDEVRRRRGSKYLGCEVIGTEISDTALDFPDTVQ